MNNFGSHRVYIHGIHQIKSFVSKGVTCNLCLQQWDTQNWIICLVKCVIQIVSKSLKFHNFTYVNFLDTIGITHFTRQMIQFCISRCCKHNFLVLFYFCVSVHRSIGQIKHQLDATPCRFYFCRKEINYKLRYYGQETGP